MTLGLYDLDFLTFPNSCFLHTFNKCKSGRHGLDSESSISIKIRFTWILTQAGAMHLQQDKCLPLSMWLNFLFICSPSRDLAWKGGTNHHTVGICAPSSGCVWNLPSWRMFLNVTTIANDTVSSLGKFGGCLVIISSFKLLRAEATILWTCCRGNGRCTVQISARPQIILTEIVRGFTYSVQ